MVTTHDRSHVVVVRQWRPTDSDSIELPGGNANKLQEAFREELLHEAGVGLDAVEEVTVYCPFVHEVARKAHVDGGACSAYVVHVRLCAGIDLTAHDFQDADTDERGKATWVSRDTLRELVRSGRLADAVTVLALMATGVLN